LLRVKYVEDHHSDIREKFADSAGQDDGKIYDGPIFFLKEIHRRNFQKSLTKIKYILKSETIDMRIYSLKNLRSSQHLYRSEALRISS